MDNRSSHCEYSDISRHSRGILNLVVSSIRICISVLFPSSFCYFCWCEKKTEKQKNAEVLCPQFFKWAKCKQAKNANIKRFYKFSGKCIFSFVNTSLSVVSQWLSRFAQYFFYREIMYLKIHTKRKIGAMHASLPFIS